MYMYIICVFACTYGIYIKRTYVLCNICVQRLETS